MDEYEALELANLVLGLPEDNDSFDKAEELLYNNFNMDLDDFRKIATALMKFTPTSKSLLTDNVYQGFVNGKFFIVKQEVKP